MPVNNMYDRNVPRKSMYEIVAFVYCEVLRNNFYPKDIIKFFSWMDKKYPDIVEAVHND